MHMHSYNVHVEKNIYTRAHFLFFTIRVLQLGGKWKKRIQKGLAFK